MYLHSQKYGHFACVFFLIQLSFSPTVSFLKRLICFSVNVYSKFYDVAIDMCERKILFESYFASFISIWLWERSYEPNHQRSTLLQQPVGLENGGHRMSLHPLDAGCFQFETDEMEVMEPTRLVEVTVMRSVAETLVLVMLNFAKSESWAGI